MVEIFTGRMGYLFEALLEDSALVHLLQKLLMQPTISRNVAPIMLQYLVDHRLKDLQQPESKVSILFDMHKLGINFQADVIAQESGHQQVECVILAGLTA